MCGIAGIFTFAKPVSQHVITNMTDSIAHRGPDGSGLWINTQANVGLGHRRLSIIDLSDNASQPMHSKSNKYTIVFNGEIYNYVELKDDLIKNGHSFHTESDTEVLLTLFELYGANCLPLLDGMFAFAIYNTETNELFCARDRFGEKPFFYSNADHRFTFASEIKAIFASGITQAVSPEKTFEYLLYATCNNPHHPDTTIYKDIYQLQPAHYLVVNSNGIGTQKNYWQLDKDQEVSISEEDAIEQFRFLFQQSVHRRLRSDVPVGSSLSGGLDSSSIVMEVNRIKKSQQQQNTFSARFPGFIRDEGYFMNLVIDSANVNPKFIYPDANSVFDNLKKIWHHQEMPFGSASIAVQYEVMQCARTNNTIVLLDGQGADELMAGYTFYRQTYLSQLFRTNRSLYQSELQALADIHNVNDLQASKLDKLQKFSFFDIDFLRKIKKMMHCKNSNYFLGIHPDLIDEFRRNPSPYSIHSTLKNHLHFSTTQIGLTELLRYADRNAMAHSVEVRLPFLYHQLAEFVFSLPEKYLISNGWTKYILRKSNENILPKEITWRKDKVGYEPPQSEWNRQGKYKEIFDESIQFLKTEKIIKEPIERLKWNYLMLYMLFTEKL